MSQMACSLVDKKIMVGGDDAVAQQASGRYGKRWGSWSIHWATLQLSGRIIHMPEVTWVWIHLQDRGGNLLSMIFIIDLVLTSSLAAILSSAGVANPWHGHHKWHGQLVCVALEP